MMDRQRVPETVAGATDRAVRAAVATVPFISVLLVDTQMRYHAVLGSAAKMHGYDPASLLGRHVEEVLAPSAFARIGPLLQRALAGETVVDIAESADGLAVYETTYAPAVDNGVGVGALAVVRDITMEHRALAELAAADAQHQMILSHISDVVALTRPDGRFSWVSPSAERVLGWPAAELLERPIFEFVHPGDVDQLRTRRAALLESGGSRLIAYRIRRPDGTWVPIESHVAAVRAAETDAITALLVTARDVTERHRLESRLAQAVEMFEQSFAAAPIGKALVGVDGRLIKVNTALCSLLGRDEAELIGRTFHEITHADDLAADVELLHETAIGAPADDRVERRYRRPDGTVGWVLLAVSVVRGDGGQPRFSIVQFQDISARKDALREMERGATTDALTGLPNRLLLTDRLRHAVALARRGGWLVGVISLDLDLFKRVNDTLGRGGGDELLRQAADRLLHAGREGDTTIRLGGDEFVVICEHVTAVSEIVEIAERLRSELSRPFTIADRDIQLSAAVGVAVGRCGTGESLLRQADRLMATAKRHQPTRIDVYAEALEVIAHDQLSLHKALCEGIGRGELRVFYQPIVDLASRAVVAREALVRWAHPTLGLLHPAAFLDGTDRTRLGVMIGERVLMQACTDATAWHSDTAVHVNISAGHLAQPDFPDYVRRCLDTTGLPADRLVLEIPESLVLAASPATLACAPDLTALGIGLSLDNFGTGYSSVTALNRLPIDSFKIDRSIIADASDNPTSASLVEGLISLGSHMDLDVIAGGIQTHEQAEWLTNRGCPHGQGYHLGRPSAPPPSEPPDA